MAKLRLSYYGHIMRREGSLEKTAMLGKIESIRKRGRPNRDELTDEATGMSLKELNDCRGQDTVDTPHS